MRAVAFSGALAFAGAALADLPPPQPENPLGEACQPFIGVWQRVEPHQSRAGKEWRVLAIDSERATVLGYWNQENINIQAEGVSYNLDCEKGADGSVTLAFTNDSESSFALVAKPVDETSFTTTEESEYLGAAPDPNWKPETLTITWKRLFR